MPSNVDLTQLLKPSVIGSSAVLVYVLAQAWVDSIQSDTRIALELVTEQAATIAGLNVQLAELRSDLRRKNLTMDAQEARLNRLENVLLSPRVKGDR